MMKEIDIERLMEGFREDERRVVTEAWEIASQQLEGRTRGNHTPFLLHPYGVAEIVRGEIGLGADAIAAVFLHEASRFSAEDAAALNGSPLMTSLARRFPPHIMEMVRGLNNISFIKIHETNLDGDRYRRLIVACSSDPRVVIIKLADRLEVIRHLECIPAARRKVKMMETIMLYAPIAHQMGLYRIKSEMEDRYLRFAEPEAYRSITNHLKAGERQREELSVHFIGPLREKLDRAGIKYTFKARTKSAYSIWKKMVKQKIPFEKIYDVFAMRFIIECPPDRKTEHELCWKVYSFVTEEYAPDISRLRDWLSVPKSNGYESLHTTVDIGGGHFVEVQIRSARMDVEAEQGSAAHWSYKGVQSEAALTGWLNRVRDLLQSGEKSDYESVRLSPDEIFVFTPTGDLRQLKKGSTILDFAFEIHSNLGVKCTGGRVNGRMASIKEVLHTGDVVEIISAKNQKPTPDWLNIAVTSKARSKIRLVLKEEENKLSAAGKEILERRARNWKIELRDDLLAQLAKKYKKKNLNEFYGLLGSGAIDIMDVKEFLSRPPETEGAKGEQLPRATANLQGQDEGIIISQGNLGKVDYRMAKCCNPIYGDEVFGFVTIKEGLKIHRMSCPNAARLFENYPYRIQKVRWREDSDTTRSRVTLKITTDNTPAISNTVLSIISRFKAAVRSFNSNENQQGSAPAGKIEMGVELYIPSNLELDKIIALLKKQKGIRQVSRI